MVKIKEARVNNKVRSLLKQAGIRFLFRPTQQRVLRYLCEKHGICAEIGVGVYRQPSDIFTHIYWKGKMLQAYPSNTTISIAHKGMTIAPIGSDFFDYSSREEMVDAMIIQALTYLLSK